MAVRQLERAEATNSFISFLLNEVSPDGRPFTSTDLMQRGDQWVDRLFAAKPELHAEMLVGLAERYGAAGDFAELATLKRAHELAQEDDLDLRPHRLSLWGRLVHSRQRRRGGGARDRRSVKTAAACCHRAPGL